MGQVAIFMFAAVSQAVPLSMIASYMLVFASLKGAFVKFMFSRHFYV
jgi:hypothetical protein